MPEQSLLILGRQPALGLAELESLFGASAVQAIGTDAALLSRAPSSVHFDRLGGSVKLCRVLTVFDTIKWPEVQKHVEQTMPRSLASSDSKLQLGLSAYGLSFKPQQLTAAGLELKKILRKGGRSVRLVPNQEAALNSAQVLHNRLTGENGCEIVLVRDGAKTICAQTVAEQDIESYTLRDRSRPKRDARVGMLPPKLAQIIINLAASEQNPTGNFTVLDPFCGTGVLLQEALLMGFSAYGTDLEPRMINYTGENLDWLDSNFQLGDVQVRFEDGDATTHLWEPQPSAVACETYLGQPYIAQPPVDKLATNVRTCNVILEKFLRNIGKQLKPGTRLCLAVPAWQISPQKFKHVPLIDRLNDLGYNRTRFEHIRDDQLLYYREDQIVARELLVLTKQ